MKRVNQPRQNITLKVALGYTVLGCLFVLSTLSVFRYTEALSRVSEAEERLAGRRLAAEDVVLDLVKVGNLEQAVAMGMKNKDMAYFDAVDSALSSIKRFRNLQRGAAQKLRLDTIASLVVMKRENTLQMLDIIQGDDAAMVYRRHIEGLLSGSDSAVVKQNLSRPVVSKERTVVVEHSKKGFFGRLADVFRRSKRDTTMVSESTALLSDDSVSNDLNISDAVANKLGKMADETSDAGRKRAERMEGRRGYLLYAGLEMTAKLQSVLKDVNKYERASFKRTIDKEIKKRKRAAVWTGCIAAIAVMLSCGSLFMVWHDVSRAREYRDQLEAARQRAEDLLRLRERLMLTVAHDIKSPAASISGFVEMSRKASPDDRQEYLDNIGKASTHLLNLVTSLLDYNRLENRRVELNAVDFDLESTMNDIVNCCRPQAASRGLKLEYISENKGGTSRYFHADIFRIRQVIENFLSNALKFTAKGEITVKSGVDDGKLTVSVSDTGPGMTPHDQERIFSAFTRLNDAQGVEGVGLGLSISRELVTLLGGTISVESKKGKGSTFSFTIPIETADNCGEQTSQDGDGAANPSIGNAGRGKNNKADVPLLQRHKIRALLIDDDDLQRQLTHAMLLRLGGDTWEVVACSKVDELFTCLNGSRFDLLLTDIEMPSMSGFGIMNHLRALGNENHAIPVIALTAHVLLDRDDFIKAGFSDCLSKPFSMEALQNSIENVLPNCKLQETGDANSPKVDRQNIEMTTNEKGKTDAPSDDIGNTLEGDSPTPPLNFSSLTFFAEGDAEAENDILQQFKHDTLAHKEGFSKAVEKGDKEEACRLAHKILPTFKLIGSPAVEALSTMESRRGQRDWTEDDLSQCCIILRGINIVIKELETMHATDDAK